MSNEELAVCIQKGERELLPELWEQVARFVAKQAHRRIGALSGAGGVEFDDLYNSGYLALVHAADSFDPEAGMQFVGWLALHLKTAFVMATGYHNGKSRNDPLHRALSLDMPAYEEGDETLGDTVADPLDPYEEAEQRIWAQQLHAELDDILDTLPEEQSETIRLRFYRNRTLADIGRETGASGEAIRQRETKALRTLRHPKHTQRLQQFIEQRTNYHQHVGLTRYLSTGISSVEEIVFLRERLGMPTCECSHMSK